MIIRLSIAPRRRGREGTVSNVVVIIIISVIAPRAKGEKEERGLAMVVMIIISVFIAEGGEGRARCGDGGDDDNHRGFKITEDGHEGA